MDNDAVKILALIPARSGSEGVRDKNIRTVADKPLLAHSIEHARASRLITRVIVTTDSEEYADIAKSYGAEAPFLRPAEISAAGSSDLEAFTHALEWLRKNEDYEPDICVHLRPTFPVRDVAELDRAIETLVNNEDFDSLRSVVSSPQSPFKMWFLGEDSNLSPAVVCDKPEAYNLPRQVLPATYMQNACFDVVRTSVILEKASMTGDSIYGYVMEHDFDIDFERELLEAERQLRGEALDGAEKRTFCFDIDGVIASIVPDNDYPKAKPIRANIELINALYNSGHRILLFTARGTKTGKDWQELTETQMKEWGVLHHELKLGKPAADYYVDDKLVNIDQVRAFVEVE